MPAYVVKKALEHRRERLRMELEAKTGGSPGEVETLRQERKLLVERIENLESIVCSVDYDLNQKLVKLIDEQRMLSGAVPALPAAGPGGAASAAGASGAPARRRRPSPRRRPGPRRRRPRPRRRRPGSSAR
ncbi:MAG: hypothetical protein H6708_15660 [Kofleriaceae bacterium]|nr:hypothetical protein [Kofleriaceae bacterium]